jgi:DNA mismatch repair protein MutL
MNVLRIQPLSTFVANQIAAGEVIERPASVVKELLENALDAGADTINIDIGFGGLNRVSISDNGAGIVGADLPLAISPHATSKITQLSDLHTITSMGFRGEALASIAAVSKLSISSKPATQEHAMLLRVEGPFSPILSPCARSQGTTVEVMDLFYNAPVRKKFLKTARSEFQAIEIIVKRFALSAPWLALTLKHDGQQILSLPAARCEKTRELRIRKLLGKLFIESAIHLSVQQSGMGLLGWVSSPDYQRSQNDKQWVYINQRMVKDKLIHHAMKQAYDDLLHPGRYPACVLYLTLPSEDVDINVHPTKHEVRFQQPRFIHDFIRSHLSEALAQSHKSSSRVVSPLVQKGPFLSSIGESFIPKIPEKRVLFSETTASASWHILNVQFGLMVLSEQPYLVDMAQLQQHWLISRLDEAPWPLACRALLVPMRYSMCTIEGELFERFQSMLTSCGIQIDLINPHEVIIRTIPLLLPQLDLKIFLRRFEDICSSLKTMDMFVLRKLLVSSQSFDAHQLSIEERALLAEHLCQCMLVSLPLMPWCVKLDIKKCIEIAQVSTDV